MTSSALPIRTPAAVKRRSRRRRIGSAVAGLFVLASTALVVPGGGAAYAESEDPRRALDWKAVQSILAGIQGSATAPIKNVTTPKFTTGMLLGNGDIGVTEGGDTTSNQKFYLGKGDFWGSAWNVGHARLDQGILSLGTLSVSSSVPSPNPAPAYTMTQDILNAEVRSTVQLGGATVSMRSFTADSDNVLVTELSTPAGSSDVPITIDLAMPGPDTHAVYATTVGGTDGTIWATRHNNFTGSTEFQAQDGIAVRPVGVGFSSTTTNGSTASGTFTLAGGSTVQLATVFRGDARAGSSGPSAATLASQAQSAVNALDDAAIGGLLQGHRDWWKDFWLRSIIQVNDPTLMQYWYGALYAMGSASRPGKVAPGMNGAWVINDFTQFPRYWMNYNFQAPFYGLASANHADLILPYTVQQNAELPWQINYTAGGGYHGEMFTRSLGPFHQFMPVPAPAKLKARNDLWTDQKSNGGFSVTPALFYYNYTHDENYLRTELYPNLRAVDDFFRDYLTWDGTRFVMAHSSAHEASVDLNPNLDIGFINRVENFLITASQQLNVDQELVPVWQDTLSKLAAYPTATVNGKTVYTMAENINGSTNPADTFKPGDQPINLEGLVFPGENLYVGGDPTQLQIAINTLQEMNSWGVTTGQNKNNGFPKEFPIAARVGWPAADLKTKFAAAIKAQWRPSNLTVAQSGGGIETSGSIEALDSMLIQSVSGTIRLFGDADWPVAQNAAFERLLAQGAFEVTASLTNGKVSPVTITSNAGQQVSLKNPWPRGLLTVFKLDNAGRPGARIRFSETNGVISFPTDLGASYQVTSTAVITQGAAFGFAGGQSPIVPLAVLMTVLGVLLVAYRMRRPALATA